MAYKIGTGWPENSTERTRQAHSTPPGRFPRSADSAIGKRRRDGQEYPGVSAGDPAENGDHELVKRGGLEIEWFTGVPEGRQPAALEHEDPFVPIDQGEGSETNYGKQQKKYGREVHPEQAMAPGLDRPRFRRGGGWIGQTRYFFRQ